VKVHEVRYNKVETEPKKHCYQTEIINYVTDISYIRVSYIGFGDEMS